jgi:hypothetical protein
MHELLPIAAGLLMGVALTLIAPRLRLWVGMLASVVLGIVATVISGEYQIGWEFLLIDIPLVAISSVIGLTVARDPRPSRVPPLTAPAPTPRGAS